MVSGDLGSTPYGKLVVTTKVTICTLLTSKLKETPLTLEEILEHINTANVHEEVKIGYSCGKEFRWWGTGKHCGDLDGVRKQELK